MCIILLSSVLDLTLILHNIILVDLYGGNEAEIGYDWW